MEGTRYTCDLLWVKLHIMGLVIKMLTRLSSWILGEGVCHGCCSSVILKKKGVIFFRDVIFIFFLQEDKIPYKNYLDGCEERVHSCSFWQLLHNQYSVQIFRSEIWHLWKITCLNKILDIIVRIIAAWMFLLWYRIMLMNASFKSSQVASVIGWWNIGFCLFVKMIFNIFCGKKYWFIPLIHHCIMPPYLGIGNFHWDKNHEFLKKSGIFLTHFF